MESRIAALDLRLRAAGDGEAIVSAATQFARRVLTRCDEVLELRYPGRLFLLRQLDTSWRVRSDHLDRDSEVDAVAHALADGIEEEVGTRPEGSMVETFAGEAEYRAAYLCAVAANEAGAWYFQRLRDEGPAPGALTDAASRPLALEVCARLAERNTLGAVLNSLADDSLDALAAAIGATALVAAAPEGEADARLAVRVESMLTGRRRDSLIRIACLVEAMRDGGRVTGESDAPAIAARAYARIGRAAREHSADTPVIPTAAVAPNDQRQRRPPVGVGQTPSITTRFGGLFYCLGPALELSLGEIAWAACVNDGAFLARIATMLIGPGAEDDPAPRVFGGSPDRLQIGPIDEERRTEMAEAMLRALVDALPRRDLARPPQIEWMVISLRSGRFLMAVPMTTDYPLFVWPAATSDALEAGLRTFNRIWPRGTPAQIAHPGLAAADPTGYVRGDVRTALARSLFVANTDDAHETALVTQAGGALAYLFAARLGSDGPGAIELLRSRFLSIPARVEHSDGAVIVTLPGDRIDLAVRRAGLDRNPGWVPWLRATVRIVFDDVSEGAMD